MPLHQAHGDLWRATAKDATALHNGTVAQTLLPLLGKLVMDASADANVLRTASKASAHDRFG